MCFCITGRFLIIVLLRFLLICVPYKSFAEYFSVLNSSLTVWKPIAIESTKLYQRKFSEHGSPVHSFWFWVSFKPWLESLRKRDTYLFIENHPSFMKYIYPTPSLFLASKLSNSTFISVIQHDLLVSQIHLHNSIANKPFVQYYFSIVFYNN